jgi:hypothetical protein
MGITAKVLIGLSTLSLLNTASLASYDTTFFRISHVEASSDLSTPAKGQTHLEISLFKVDGGHELKTPMLLLGQTYQDHVKEVPLFCPNITGQYFLSAYCHGQGAFATQETFVYKSFSLERGDREIDISYACPVNHGGTVISAPQEMKFEKKRSS